MAALDDQLEQTLYGYIPGLEKDTIKEIYDLFHSHGFRKLMRADPSPEDQWRSKAEEKNNALAAKYGPKKLSSLVPA